MYSPLSSGTRSETAWSAGGLQETAEKVTFGIQTDGKSIKTESTPIHASLKYGILVYKQSASSTKVPN